MEANIPWEGRKTEGEKQDQPHSSCDNTQIVHSWSQPHMPLICVVSCELGGAKPFSCYSKGESTYKKWLDFSLATSQHVFIMRAAVHLRGFICILSKPSGHTKIFTWPSREKLCFMQDSYTCCLGKIHNHQK